MKIVSSVGVLAGVDCSWCTMVAMSLCFEKQGWIELETGCLFFMSYGKGDGLAIPKEFIQSPNK